MASSSSRWYSGPLLGLDICRPKPNQNSWISSLIPVQEPSYKCGPSISGLGLSWPWMYGPAQVQPQKGHYSLFLFRSKRVM